MTRLCWKHTLAATFILGGTDGTAHAQCPTTGPCPPAGTVSPMPAGKVKLLPRPPWPDAPLGASVELYMQTQISNGVATRMALYDYDFLPDTAVLNPHGKDRVRQIAGWVSHNQFPVIIERLPANPALAEARRRVVLNELVAVVGAIPPDRVVVGRSPTAPLRGAEAELIYQNLLQLTASAGTMPSTGVGGGTSSINGSGTNSTTGTTTSTNRQ